MNNNVEEEADGKEQVIWIYTRALYVLMSEHNALCSVISYFNCLICSCK